ncbi:MAG: hypothetical protein Kow0081_0770 [Candidatus Dojkabacteria bacterium]
METRKNYWKGRGGYHPEAIVIHIAEGWIGGAYSWFNNPNSQASAHYMVGKSGNVWQFVDDNNTAWHAGGVNKPSWSLLKPGITPNLYTIGIEHEGFSGEKFTEQMYNSSAELLANLARKFQIPLDREHIIGHNKINSISRGRCPGNGVDLDKLINLSKNKLGEQKMITELQQKISDLENRIKQLEQSNSLLNVTNENLRKQIDGLSDQLDSENRKNRNLEEQINLLAGSDDRVNSLIRENSVLRQQIVTLQKSIADLNKKLLDKNLSSNKSFLDRLKDLFI